MKTVKGKLKHEEGEGDVAEGMKQVFLEKIPQKIAEASKCM